MEVGGGFRVRMQSFVCWSLEHLQAHQCLTTEFLWQHTKKESKSQGKKRLGWELKETL